ncbi:MAG: DUF3488 and transglutaminase-like domain-containing protein [Planctomycetota bacterium]|nr:DUF3488 and transglutaminase-like domain-containing protein [Planctomycetota bacterium]
MTRIPGSIRPRVSVLVLATSLLMVLAYGIAEGNVAMGAFLAASVVVAFALSGGARPRPWPKLYIHLLIAGIVLRSVLDVVGSRIDVTAFCEFIGLVLAVKMADRRRARDQGQILTLAAFLGVGAILTSNDLGVGVCLLLGVPMLVLSTMLLQLDGGFERAGRAALGAQHVSSAAPITAPTFPADARARATVSRDARGVALLAGLSTGLILLGSAIVFVLMPRGLGASLAGNFGQVATGSVTGFRNDIQLGRAGLISESQTTVAEVQILRDDRRSRRQLESGQRVYYFRGAVLDEYDAGWWRAGEPSGERERPVRDAAPARAPVMIRTLGPEGREALPWLRGNVVARVTLRGADREEAPIFSPGRPTMVRFEERCQVTFWPATGAITRTGRPGRVEYQVSSTIDGDAPTPDRRTREVSFPSDVVRDFARRVLVSAGVEPDPTLRAPSQDMLAAATLEAHLRDRFSYSLNILAPPAGADPIEWFLLQGRSGHCEYFASALAALCRSVGVSARVVTGYLVSEFDPGSERYVVRQADAHAWTEVEQSPGLWRTLDATPPSELARLASEDTSAGARFERLIDRLRDSWVSTIVVFDEQARNRLLRPPATGVRAIDRRLASVSDVLRFRNPTQSIRAIGTWLTWAAGSLIALGAVYALWGLLRSRLRPLLSALGRRVRGWLARSALGRWILSLTSGPLAPGAPSEAAGWYARALAETERAGFAKPAWQGPLDFARDVGSRRPAVGGALESVVALVYRARWSKASLDTDDARRAREALAELSRAARASENR